MDLKNFDKQIKSALDNIEAPFDSASWQALESRMNSAFTEEQPAPVEPVDLVVKRTLERFEVPYQAADWNVLNSRLNQNVVVRRIRLSKVAEAAIFLLLLVNIEGFLGGFREVLKPAPPQPPKAAVPMAKLHRAKSAKQLASATPSTDATSLTDLAEHVVALLVSPFESKDVQSIAAPETLALVTVPEADANSSVLDGSNFYGHSGIVPFNKIAPLPHAKTIDFAWNNFFEIIPGVTVPAPRKANGVYAGTYGSYNKDHISSTDFSARETGLGGGIMVGYRKGKWGVETGVAYSPKNYAPKKDAHIYAGDPIDGFLAAYVKDVNADVFSVPVKASRRLARIGNTTVHAVAGLTANVATEKRVTYKSVYYPPLSPMPTNGIDPAQNPIPYKDNNGFLEGGSLRTNAYATADIGLRLEQSLGRHYIAFVEPTYRQGLGGGFGPKREHINTISFQAGVMATL